MLRAIERQQNLKENLFLVLLQKREEAAINLAVTAPSIKVIDYALSSGPTAPKKVSVYGISAFTGLLLPFGFFFCTFHWTTKFTIEKTWKKPCPIFPLPGKFLTSPRIQENIRNALNLSESFRILVTNIKFLLKNKCSGKGKDRYGHLFGEGRRKNPSGYGTGPGLFQFTPKGITCRRGPSKSAASRIFRGR